jgi:ankyrin repeat protein
MINEILRPKSKEEILSRFSNVDSLLYESSRKGFIQGVEWAIENGADIKNSTAIIYAAAKGYQDIIELLLRYETNIFIINDALYCAALNQHYIIVKLLLKNGADINAYIGAKQLRQELLNLK